VVLAVVDPHKTTSPLHGGTTQIIPADDPSNPTGRDVPFSHGLHQTVDLASVAGNCVYAAYIGRIVKLQNQPGGNTANVSIDHHPRGLGFVTNYNHIAEVRVAEVHSSARVSRSLRSRACPRTRRCISSSGRSAIARIPEMAPPGDSDMVPVDPTRALYAWERRLVAYEPLAGPQIPIAVGSRAPTRFTSSSRGSRPRSRCTCPCTSR
jgi:hypothetical protein